MVRELQLLLLMTDFNQKTLTKFTGEHNMRLMTSVTIMRVMERYRKLMILLMLLFPFILLTIGVMTVFATSELTYYYGAAKHIVFNLFE